MADRENAPRDLAKSAPKCVILDKTFILSRRFVNIEKTKKIGAGQRQEQSFPALEFEILKCDLRTETKITSQVRFFADISVNFDFLKSETF